MCPFGFVCHKGKRIAVVDCSNATPEEAISIMRDAQQRMALLHMDSLLVLTVTVNSKSSEESRDVARQFIISYAPHVRASAVVGADGTGDVFRGPAGQERHPLEAFATQVEAMDWLVRH